MPGEKVLVLSGFQKQKFAGNLKEVGQIVPDRNRISLYLSGHLPSTFLQTFGSESQIKPAIFPSGSLGLDEARVYIRPS